MSKPTAKLKEWRLTMEFGFPQLVGYVDDHNGRPDLRDGMKVRTSRVLRIDFELNEAETLNTKYLLSDPLIPQ